MKSDINLHGHIFNADVLQGVWESVVKVKPMSKPMVDMPTSSLDKSVKMLQHLRGRPEDSARAVANAQAVGGMRNPKRSLESAEDEDSGSSPVPDRLCCSG